MSYFRADVEMKFIYEFLLVFLWIVVIWLVWPRLIGAVWIPTPRGVVRKMLHLAGVGEDDTLF